MSVKADLQESSLGTHDIKIAIKSLDENIVSPCGVTIKNVAFEVSLLHCILFHPTMEGCLGTTDEFATIPFHLVLFSAALVELAKSIPVHSLILSSHLFLCLPLFFPFTVPSRIVIAKPEMWPNHLCFHFLTRVRNLLYSPMAVWIFIVTSSLLY